MANHDVRSRLLVAAGKIFADKGFRQATVREICRAANVNVASVNYYFGDKEHLYLEVVRLARTLRAEQFPLPAWPPGTPPEQRLRDFVGVLLRRVVAVKEASWNSRLMIREILEPTEACRDLVEQYVRPQFEMLVSILREMLPTDVPGHLLRKIAFSLIGQCVYYRAAGEIVTMLTPADELQEHFQLDQIADHIVRLCLAGLGVTSSYDAPTESLASSRQI
jgi:AcrR family transcriptional regulator